MSAAAGLDGLEAPARRTVAYLYGVGLLLLAMLLGLYTVSRPAALPGVANIHVATAQPRGAEPAPPQAVRLPHILGDETAPWHAGGRYTLAWPAGLVYAPTEDVQLAMLLPRVGTRFRVLLNDHELFHVGWHAAPERTINAAWLPYFVPLPSALLASVPAANTLEIEVAGPLLERSGLWPVQIGDYDRLYARHDVLYGWQVTGTWMMVITALLMGAMSVFLWVLLRERLFGLMALASAAHVVRLVLSVLVEPPLSYDAYFLLHRIAFTLYVALICLIIEDLFGLGLRVVRWMAYALMVVGPLWMLVTLLSGEYDYYRVWAGLLAAVAFFSLLLVLWGSRLGRELTPDQWLVGMVAVFTLVTGVRDFLVVQLNFSGDADLRWTSISSLVLMLTLGWVLLQRTTASVREVGRLNATLAQTVARREGELRTAFNQLRESERQRAVEHERRRLMRDMHDGLGSQLVQTLNAVRTQGQGMDHQVIEGMLYHALEELRITLDSLEPMDGDLPTILGTLRQRIAPALEAAGIELDWQVQEVPEVPSLDARGVMHLFRCIQEVFANVVKHAQATRVTVRTWAQDGRVCLSVADNGRGFLTVGAGASGGRGLNNIRVRAEKIGAEVAFQDAAPGTLVVLAFALGPHQEPPDTQAFWADDL